MTKPPAKPQTSDYGFHIDEELHEQVRSILASRRSRGTRPFTLSALLRTWLRRYVSVHAGETAQLGRPAPGQFHTYSFTLDKELFRQVLDTLEARYHCPFLLEPLLRSWLQAFVDGRPLTLPPPLDPTPDQLNPNPSTQR